MTSSLIDSRQEIAKLDKSNMIDSIESLGKQIEQAWQDTRSLKFTKTQPIEQVVVAGMGGSGLGADVIKHAFKHELKVPFEVIHSYHLPAYVDPNTLVILSSYSGTTEEVLSCGLDAKERHAQVAAITTGSKLAELAKQENWLCYIIDPQHNPCGQPRMDIGSSIFGIIGLCVQAGILPMSDDVVEQIITTIKQTLARCSVEMLGEENPAKLLAYTMLDRRSVLVSSEFIEGALHVATNQSNENAKSFTTYAVVPELNHHLMEGLRFPSSNASTQLLIIIQSKLFLPANQKRLELTAQVVEKNEIETLTINLEAKSQLAQIFEMIALFSFASFYLSMLEGIDPSPIPYVDWFKDQLKA